MENQSKPQKKGRKTKTTKSEKPVENLDATSETIKEIKNEESVVAVESKENDTEEIIEEDNKNDICVETIESVNESVNEIVSEIVHDSSVTVLEKIIELDNVVNNFIKIVDEDVTSLQDKNDNILNSSISEEIITVTADEKEIDNTLNIKSLLNLLIIISVRQEMQEKYKLNGDLVKVLTLILQIAPTFFLKIEDSFKKIVSDNKIDSDDVPELMNIFSKMYELMVSLKSQNNSLQLSNLCGDLIKLTFNIMLTEGLIIFESSTPELSKSTFNALVDSSVELIKLNNKIKLSNKCCFFW
jgi:hypothetical protein